MRQTLLMRPLAAERQRWMLGFLVISSVYSAVVGESLYPYSLLLALLSVIVAASIFNRVATVITLGISCLVVAYFVIPPVFSFRMEGRELLFFIAYVSAALVGCVAMQLRRHVTDVSGRDQGSSYAEARSEFVLTCDSEGALLLISPELLAFTGRRQNQVEGFLWLGSVATTDRGRLVSVIQSGHGKLQCRFIDVAGQNRSFDVSVESRYWTVSQQLPPERFFRKTVVLIATEVVD